MIRWEVCHGYIIYEYERYLSTKKEKTEAKTRIFKAYAYENRKEGCFRTATEEADAFNGLTPPVFMLPSPHRLRKKNDIERVLRKGERFTNSFFRVLVLKNASSNSRFSVIVPKKTTKEAHVRNRLKRQIIETLRRNYALVPKGYDIVIFVFPPALGESSHVLTGKLAAIFHVPLSR